MTPNELAASLFKPHKRKTPIPLKFGQFSWHEWRVPISFSDAERLATKGKREFKSFSWHIDNLASGLKLIVRCPTTGKTLEERVNLLRGEVEEGIE